MNGSAEHLRVKQGRRCMSRLVHSRQMRAGEQAGDFGGTPGI